MLPNVIIAGAPRCGTTALFEYLSHHPEVSSSSIKETCYFIDEGYFSSQFLQSKLPKYYSHPLSEYEKFFENSNGGGKVIIEASPDYLYQLDALASLAQLKSNPKVIFILRKPSSRVYSMYRFSQGQLGIISDQMSFANFVQRAKDTDYFGKQGLNILDNVIENGKYINYLRKFSEHFGRERMTIILFEDLIDNPNKILSRIALDLGIDDSYFDAFEASISNNSVVVRSKLLQRIVKKFPIPLGLRYGDSYVKKIAKNIYRALNTNSIKAPVSSANDVLLQLDKVYRESNAELKNEFNLDIERWG